MDPLQQCGMTLPGTTRGVREQPQVMKVKANSAPEGRAFHFTNDTSLGLRTRHRGLCKAEKPSRLSRDAHSAAYQYVGTRR